MVSDGAVVVMPPDPFRGMGAWKNSTKTQQSGHAQRSEMKEVVSKMACRRGSDTPTPHPGVVRSPPLLRVVGQNGEATFSKASDHPVVPNRLEFSVMESSYQTSSTSTTEKFRIRVLRNRYTSTIQVRVLFRVFRYWNPFLQLKDSLYRQFKRISVPFTGCCLNRQKQN